jgi:hypothetical protein
VWFSRAARFGFEGAWLQPRRKAIKFQNGALAPEVFFPAYRKIYETTFTQLRITNSK